MPTPRVAILTVTTDAAVHLPAYLDALSAVSYPAWDLWVVDNASTDGSADMVACRLPRARVLSNERNLGFTGACNRAIREIVALPSPPDYVLFLNDDTEVSAGFLEPLVAAAGPRTMVAPRTYLAGRPGTLDDAAGEFDWWRGAWRHRSLGRPEGPADRVRRPVETANLSCLLVPLAAFADAGLLDDAFFVYYDDTDFCRRAARAGYGIVVEPESVVHHRKGATLGGQASPFGCYYLARNRPYLIRKHRSRSQFGVFFGYFIATRTVRSALWLIEGRRDLVRATWRGVSDFVRGRMGEGRPPVPRRRPMRAE